MNLNQNMSSDSLSNNLFCSYFNAQSLTNKFDDLEFELEVNNSLKIVSIVETWLTSEYDDACLSFCKNYQIFRLDRIIRLHGGVMFLIHKSIPAIKIFGICFEGYIEVLCLKLIIHNKKFYFLTVYRSPNTSQTADVPFIQYMSSRCWDMDLIVAGDFNLPGLFTKNFHGIISAQSYEYENLFNDLNLCLMVHEPTRGGNLLDYIMTSDELLITNVIIGEGFSTSDHNKITFQLNISNDKNLNYGQLNYNFRLGDYTQMSVFLDTIDWDGLFKNISDVNEMWEVFSNILDYAIHLFIPKYKGYKNIKNKWTINTRKAYSTKLKLWRKYKKEK